MKNVILVGVFTSVIFFACSKEDSINVDFTATVTGESPNAQVVINNNSTGATSYSWSFGEGASISSSSDKDPETITIDKVGDFTIKLAATNGTDKMEKLETIIITGNNGILHYQDIEFATETDNTDFGRFFIVSTGEILKDSEVTSDNGSRIDIAYNQYSSTMSTGFFSSPNNLLDDFVVPGAISSFVENYVTDKLTVSQFDTMNDDSILSSLDIKGDNNATKMSDEIIILFRTGNNKNGAIKTKAINISRLLVDIKVQKY